MLAFPKDFYLLIYKFWVLKDRKSQGAFDLLESHSVNEWNLDMMVTAMLSLFFHHLHMKSQITMSIKSEPKLLF